MIAHASLGDVDAVVFDLDDTLIDWWTSTERTLSAVAERPTVERLQAFCRERYWERRPDSDDVWHRNTWAIHHRRTDDWPVALAHLDPSEVVALTRRFDEALWVDFFPDTVATLEALADRHRLAVLSNNQHVAAEAERLGLGRWFEVIDAAPPHAPKPAPDPFRTVAAKLGIEPSRCAYVGDSVRADVLGSRAAGMVPVWFNAWGDRWEGRPTDVVEIGTLWDLVAAPTPG